MTPTLAQLSGPQFPHPQAKGELMAHSTPSGSDILFLLHSVSTEVLSCPQGNKEHNTAQGRQSMISEPLEHSVPGSRLSGLGDEDDDEEMGEMTLFEVSHIS